MTAQVNQLFEKEVGVERLNKYLALKMCEQIPEYIKLISARDLTNAATVESVTQDLNY